MCLYPARRAWILAALSFPVLAQQLPDGEKLTHQAQDAIEKLHSLEMVVETTLEMGPSGAAGKTTSTTLQAFRNPGRMRAEVKSAMGEVMVVSDGETTWVYMGNTHQYTRRAAALGPAAMAASLGVHLPDISQVKMQSKTLREETIAVDGQKHACWVVETRMELPPLNTPGPQPTALDSLSWIDEKLNLALRREFRFQLITSGAEVPTEVRQSMVTTSLKVDQPLPDSLFAFTPPADAHETPEILNVPAAPQADLFAKDAPEFRMQSLDGTAFSKAALAGKPVLLDFWATWCGPCRKSMPVVEKLSQEFRAQGLVVIGVNAGEDRETVTEFLKTTPFAYPVALGIESDILAAFHVTAYPTFVLIGPDGKVAAHQIGFGGEQGMREMLQRVGLNTPAKPQ